MWGGGVVGRFGIRPHFLQYFLAPFPKWSLRGFLYIFTLSSTNRDCRELHFNNTEPLIMGRSHMSCNCIFCILFLYFLFGKILFCILSTSAAFLPALAALAITRMFKISVWPFALRRTRERIIWILVSSFNQDWKGCFAPTWPYLATS